MADKTRQLCDRKWERQKMIQLVDNLEWAGQAQADDTADLQL